MGWRRGLQLKSLLSAKKIGEQLKSVVSAAWSWNLDYLGDFYELVINEVSAIIGRGSVDLLDFLDCIMVLCENNQANDRHIFIKIEKMVRAMKQTTRESTSSSGLHR